jgi:hypothetical protein
MSFYDLKLQHSGSNKKTSGNGPVSSTTLCDYEPILEEIASTTGFPISDIGTKWRKMMQTKQVYSLDYEHTFSCTIW